MVIVKDDIEKIDQLATFGIVTGIVSLFVGVLFRWNKPYLIYGCVSIFLSFGLFKLWGWARIATLVFSLYIILLNLLFIYGIWLEIAGYRQTWALFGTMLLLPTSVWAIMASYILIKVTRGGSKPKK